MILSGKAFSMSTAANIIDSHVHLDLIVRHHPNRVPWLIEKGCSVNGTILFHG